MLPGNIGTSLDTLSVATVGRPGERPSTVSDEALSFGVLDFGVRWDFADFGVPLAAATFVSLEVLFENGTTVGVDIVGVPVEMVRAGDWSWVTAADEVETDWVSTAAITAASNSLVVDCCVFLEEEVLDWEADTVDSIGDKSLAVSAACLEFAP